MEAKPPHVKYDVSAKEYILDEGDEPPPEDAK